MAAEEVGGLSLPITADFSGLDADFQAAIATAVSDGATLAEAINRALKLPDTTPIQDALATIGTASEATVGQLSQAAKGMEDFGQAANSASQPIAATAAASTELGSAAQTAAAGATEAGTAWASFGSTLLGLAGITFTIGALRELVVGSIEVADKIGDTEQSLTRLTGSASQAADMMKRLRSLADDDGLSFPGLLTAVTRLQTLLPAGADVVGVMGELANVSEMLGTSIESTGQKFTAIVDGTSVSQKMLTGLGLTMGDLRTAMDELGISADVAFKSLSHGEKFDVVTTALQKFDGAAKELNDDIKGDWTRAMNAAQDAMKNLGDAIGDSEHKFSVFSTTVKVVEGVTLSLVAGLKVMIDGIVGSSTVVVEAIKGMATAWGDMAKGMLQAAGGDFTGAFTSFKNAAKDASTAFDNIKAASIFAVESIKKDWTDGTNALDKAFTTTKTGANDAATGVAHLGDTFDGATEKVKKHAEGLTVLAKATHDFVDIAKAAADGMLSFETATQRAWDKVGLFAASQEHINELLAVSKERFDAGQMSADAYGKVLAEVDKVNKALVASLDAVNKIAKEIADAAWAKTIKDGLTAASDAVKGLTSDATKAAPPISDLNKAMIDAGIGAGKMKTAIEDLKTPVEQLVTGMQKLVEQAQRTGDWSAVIQDLDNFDKRIQNLAKTDLPEADRQMQVFIQGMIDAKAPAELVEGQLIKLQAIVEKMGKEGLPQAANAMKGYLDLLKQVPTAVNDIISKQENQVANDEKLLSLLLQRKDAIGAILQTQAQWYADEIKLGELQGKNVEAYIAGAEKVKLEIESNRIATHGLADEYSHMIDDVLKGFDQMGSVMADAIVNGHNLGKALIDEFKKIGASILADVINAALLPLKKELLDLISSTLPDVFKGLKMSADGVGNLSAAATAGAAAQATHTAATVANTSATTVSAASLLELGVAAQLASIQMFTMIGAIAGIVGAVAGIVGDIYLAAIDTKLFHLNTAALSIFNEVVNARKDAWDQFNSNFLRFGEIKNDLDAIAASVKVLTQAAPAAVAEDTRGALGKIAATMELALAQETSTADSSKWSLAALNLIAGSTAQISDLLANAIQDDFANIIVRLDSIISAILYGNHSAQENSQAQMDSFSDINDAVMSARATMAQGFDDVVGATDGADSNRHNDDRSNYERQIASLERIVAVNTSSAQGAHDAVTAIQFLQKALVAEQQLAILAQEANDIGMANQYRSGAEAIAQQIRSLDGHAVSSTTSTLAQMVASDKSSAAYISSAATNIVVAVGSAANVISGAVYAAGALTAQQLADMAARIAQMGGAYATGQGTNTYIPKGTGAFPAPVTQTSNPGNSGAAGGPGPNGGGGYVTPLPPTNTNYTPPNPQYPTMHNPDGSVAEGNLVPQKNQNPFDPINPFTWTNNMTQAQWDAINNSHMPSFDEGGPVHQTGMAMVHAGEFVLSNDMIDKITGSGGAGDSLTAAAARLALALQAAQIAAEMQQAAAADMRAAQITQLTASKAMAEAAERQSVAQQELSVAQARAIIADEQKRAADAAVAAASGKSADEQAAAAKQAQIAAAAVVQAAQLLQIAGQHISEASVAMQSAQDGQRDAMMGIANAAREQQVASAMASEATRKVQMAQDAQTNIAGGAQLGLAQANSDWSKLAGVNSDFIENQLAYAKSIANWRILSGNVPSFDNGGIVGKDMLSLVHKDEMVLPPDISLMLRSMATTPALPGRVPSYSGAPAAGQGGIGSTIINMPVTFNGVTDAKQLMDMWTQRVKLLIPRATVFSS